MFHVGLDLLVEFQAAFFSALLEGFYEDECAEFVAN